MRQRQFDALNKTFKQREKLDRQFRRQLSALLSRVNATKANPRPVLWVKHGSGLAGPYKFQRMLEGGKVALEMIETGSDRNVRPESLLVGPTQATAKVIIQ